MFKKYLNVFRSGLFSSIVILVSFFWSLVFFPWLIICMITKKPMSQFVAVVWSRSIMFFARVVIGLKYEVRGLDNLPEKHVKFIVASKHQSAWETIIFFTIFRTSYVFRHEIAKLPLFGWYLKPLGQIALVRKSKGKSIEGLVKNTDIALQKNYKPVIFPEGTRRPFKAANTNYRSGIYYVSKSLKVDVVPASLNSGYVWPRNSFFSKKVDSKIIMEFLPIVSCQLNKETFMKSLEDKIEAKNKELEGLV